MISKPSLPLRAACLFTDGKVCIITSLSLQILKFKNKFNYLPHLIVNLTKYQK